MITTKEAAAIAKQHGLTLSDAAALARLANTTEEAEEAAAMFSPVPSQLTRDDIRGWPPEAINKAREDGQLTDLLGQK
jgi:hypothetical protein